MRFTSPSILILSLLVPAVGSAAVCVVDPAGAYSGPLPTYSATNSAVAGACDGTDSFDVVYLYCPPMTGPCTHQPFALLGRTNTTYLVAVGDPSTVSGTTGAITIRGSADVRLLGRMDATTVFGAAVAIDDSRVMIRGVSGWRHSVFSSSLGRALHVRGASKVSAEVVRLTASQLGLRVESSVSGHPSMELREAMLDDNAAAGEVTGGTGQCGAPGAGPRVSFRIGRNDQPSYVERNRLGFTVSRSARLTLSDVIMLRNLWAPIASSDALVRAEDAALVTMSNVLAYDNDIDANPAVDLGHLTPTDWNGYQGHLISAEDCASIDVDGSTFAQNQLECTLQVASAAAQVSFIDSVGFQSGNKGACCSVGPITTQGRSTIFQSGGSNYQGLQCNGVGAFHPLNVSVDPGLAFSNAPNMSPWPIVRNDLFLAHVPYGYQNP